jgi:hypothetical protein
MASHDDPRTVGISSKRAPAHLWVWLALTRTIAAFALLAWVYVAFIAVFYPPALHVQFTHFTKEPHTDTFGEVSFVVSFVSYLAYRLLVERYESGGRDGPTPGSVDTAP